MSPSTPPLSDSQLQDFVGTHYQEVTKHLVDIGYAVHLSRSGPHAFGSVSGVALVEGQPPPPKEHRAFVHYDGNDSDQKCERISQEYW